jgi:hypothetical protein
LFYLKEEMENPFSLFLPREFQQENSRSFKNWVLLKPLKQTAKSSLLLTKPKEEEKVATPDIMMIPLKQQYKFEKYSAGEMKAKKRKSNVDFTDAIIEYNKQKQVRVNALGAEDGEDGAEMINEYQNNDIDKEIQTQQEKLEELMQKKIQANLGILSQEAIAKNCASSEGTPATSSIYTYDPQKMNKLFAKPEVVNDRFDPASKIRSSKHKAVNKRRMTNAVTRMKNNHSLTYVKKADTSKQNGNGSSVQ